MSGGYAPPPGVDDLARLHDPDRLLALLDRAADGWRTVRFLAPPALPHDDDQETE